MTYIGEGKGTRNDNDSNDGRRRFLRGAAVASVLGAVALTPAMANQSAAAQQAPADNSDMPPDVKADIERCAGRPVGIAEAPQASAPTACSMRDSRFITKSPLVEAFTCSNRIFRSIRRAKCFRSGWISALSLCHI